MDLFNYERRKSSEVKIGNTPLGGNNPIRIQSMTTTPTTDTEASVEQCKRIIQAGADYVRLTTQGTREAENLRNIRKALRNDHIETPLVADVHFNPAVADLAATIVEKVRINPGNYVDPARTFKHLEYTDEEYHAELLRLESRFKKLLDICRKNHTAIRIGVNHGSLSDRIMSRYGDTPEGIVESCMEFLRVCRNEKFQNVVISIKASNTVVMVRSVRLLCKVMKDEGMHYPLHLGVTEAGEGEDGRIKSAIGIGALLSDGLGDTIRVSLSEDPECEIPVARHLVDYIGKSEGHMMIPGKAAPDFNYLSPERRKTRTIHNIGGDNPPVVISMRTEGQTTFGAQKPDYIYCGQTLPSPKERIAGTGYLIDANHWTGEPNTYPVYSYQVLMMMAASKADMKFVFVPYGALNDEVRACLRLHPECVVVAQSNHQNRVGELRALIHELTCEGLENPVVVFQHYSHTQAEKENFQLESAADMGALLIDGLCDGFMLYNIAPSDSATPGIGIADIDQTSFAILQAARLRTTRTEYISCPGCGRTLYDLQSTIARVKAATREFTGLKIGIMGCIVNGPGEMADADYGYVGAARGHISLYRKKECIERNIPESEAVGHLLKLIRNDQALSADKKS